MSNAGACGHAGRSAGRPSALLTSGRSGHQLFDTAAALSFNLLCDAMRDEWATISNRWAAAVPKNAGAAYRRYARKCGCPRVTVGLLGRVKGRGRLKLERVESFYASVRSYCWVKAALTAGLRPLLKSHGRKSYHQRFLNVRAALKAEALGRKNGCGRPIVQLMLKGERSLKGVATRPSAQRSDSGSSAPPRTTKQAPRLQARTDLSAPSSPCEMEASLNLAGPSRPAFFS